jgi:Spy/CpxP family protein refolding chaperone
MQGPGVGDQIKQAYQMEARKKALDSVMAMMKKELKYVETDEQKKKLDDREKKGGGSEE